MAVARASSTPRPAQIDGAAVEAALDRHFEAVIFDWDGTAVTHRAADASALRRIVEQLCSVGMDLAVVTGTHIDNVDGQLAAHPNGPGRLYLCLNRGSEVFAVGEKGPELVARREASPAEDEALTAAAEATVAVLGDEVTSRNPRKP
jgi:hydroxymethylpyrimidine pyrophosphatase-like HAD family hydrolase